MLQPTAGELLGGVHRTLTSEVLPEMPNGVAQRQLKAALVILRRLERAWDRIPAYLEAEAVDVDETLRRILSGDAGGRGDHEAADLIERLPAASLARVGESVLAARDAELQMLLIDVEAHLRTRSDPAATAALADLRALYGRMLRRQDEAWATARGV